MKEKDMFELIDKIIEDDLQIDDIELDITELEAPLNSNQIDNIQNRIFEKLNIKKSNEEYGNKAYRKETIKAHKNYKKHFSFSIKKTLIAAIIIIGMLSTVVLAKYDLIYKFIPQRGGVISSEGSIYSLKNPLEQVVEGSKITLEDLVMDTSNNNCNAKIVTSKGRITESEVILGENRFKSGNNSSAGGGEGGSFWYSYSDITSYNEGDKITVNAYLDNKKLITFEAELEKIEGVSDYNSLGPTDTKENISITAVVKEIDHILDVNFITPNKEGEQIVYYGDEFNQKNEGIYLRDSMGAQVKGERLFHNDRNNHMQFNIEGLVKPYKIILPQVTIEMRNENLANEEIKIKVPKPGEKIDINKEIKIEDGTIKILQGHRLGNNEEQIIWGEKKDVTTNYILSFKLISNKPNRILTQFKISSIGTLFNIKGDFSGYGSEYNEKGVIDKVIIDLDKPNKNTLKLNITSVNYLVNGNWEFSIE